MKETDDHILKNIAITAMTGKGAESAKDHLADLAVKAISSVMEISGTSFNINKDNIKIEKKVGGISRIL